MTKIKNILKNFAIAMVVIATAVACDDKRGYDDYDTGTTATQALNGEWWITITDEATGNVEVEHALHKTFDNNGQLYISDRVFGATSPTFTGWWLETALDADVSNLTFSATNELNTADDSAVTITEGKIIKGGGHSASGVVTDSIYFKAVFDYEPTQTLIYSGHKRTGFEEDEH